MPDTHEKLAEDRLAEPAASGRSVFVGPRRGAVGGAPV
jgi:hypothetical protein